MQQPENPSSHTHHQPNQTINLSTHSGPPERGAGRLRVHYGAPGAPAGAAPRVEGGGASGPSAAAPHALFLQRPVRIVCLVLNVTHVCMYVGMHGGKNQSHLITLPPPSRRDHQPASTRSRRASRGPAPCSFVSSWRAAAPRTSSSGPSSSSRWGSALWPAPCRRSRGCSRRGGRRGCVCPRLI